MSSCSIEHAAVSVRDLDRSAFWYRQHFGFEELRRVEKPQFGIRAATMSAGDALLELIEPGKPSSVLPCEKELAQALSRLGTNHLAIAVPDVAACRERLAVEGADFVGDLVDGRFFFVRDPDGALLEIKQGKSPEPLSAGSETRSTVFAPSGGLIP